MQTWTSFFISLMISFLVSNLAVKVKVKSFSRVWHFVTTWTVAYRAPPSMEFSRQEYWSGLPFPSPGDLPNPGIETRSPELQADALPSEPPGALQSSSINIYFKGLLWGLNDLIHIKWLAHSPGSGKNPTHHSY